MIKAHNILQFTPSINSIYSSLWFRITFKSTLWTQHHNVIFTTVTEFNGPPDPLHGNAPYLMVRKTAKVIHLSKFRIFVWSDTLFLVVHFIEKITFVQYNCITNIWTHTHIYFCCIALGYAAMIDCNYGSVILLRFHKIDIIYDYRVSNKRSTDKSWHTVRCCMHFIYMQCIKNSQSIKNTIHCVLFILYEIGSSRAAVQYKEKWDWNSTASSCEHEEYRLGHY